MSFHDTTADVSLTPGAPRWRHLVAAIACVLSLGVGWSTSFGSMGHQTPGLLLPYTFIGVDGDMYVGQNYYPGYWAEGDPYRAARGAESSERVILVPLAVALGWAATDRTGRSRQVARPAAVAFGVLAVLSASRGMPAATATMVVGLVVVWPLARTAR